MLQLFFGSGKQKYNFSDKDFEILGFVFETE